MARGVRRPRDVPGQPDCPGNLQITLDVEGDVDREATRDEVYEVIWLSDIDPLDRIALRIGDGTATGEVADYSVKMDSDTSAESTEAFGDRPWPTCRERPRQLRVSRHGVAGSSPMNGVRLGAAGQRPRRTRC